MKNAHIVGGEFSDTDTPEISMETLLDELVEEGDYRLRIDGRMYASVDKQMLVVLIEHGVLLGSEELAVSDGPWMSVREHPMLERLRSALAVQLHHLCAELQYGNGVTGAAPSPDLRRDPIDWWLLFEYGVIAAAILSLFLLFGIYALIIGQVFF